MATKVNNINTWEEFFALYAKNENYGPFDRDFIYDYIGDDYIFDDSTGDTITKEKIWEFAQDKDNKISVEWEPYIRDNNIYNYDDIYIKYKGKTYFMTLIEAKEFFA